MARETWTDERLDALVRELRGEVRELRTEMNTRFDSMQRTMILGCIGIIASIAAGVIGGVVAPALTRKGRGRGGPSWPGAQRFFSNIRLST